MSYILQRTDQGCGYVAPSGGRHSYVRDPRGARLFDTVSAAEADRCPDNEVIREYFPHRIGKIVTPLVRCSRCGEADNTKGSHGAGRCGTP